MSSVHSDDEINKIPFSKKKGGSPKKPPGKAAANRKDRATLD